MAKASDLLKKIKGGSAADLLRDRGVPGEADAVAGGGYEGATAKSMGMTPAEYQAYKKRKALEDQAAAKRKAAGGSD